MLWLMRAGLAGRGLVFLILGGFAGLSAAGSGARPVGTTGALHSLTGSPAGWALAALVIAGMACFALLRATQALFDLHGYGDDLAGIAQRTALGAAGLFYAGLAIVAISIALGWNVERSGNEAVRDWTAWLMGLPGGTALVGLIGLATVATGIGLAIAGAKRSFQRRLRVEPRPRPYVAAIGIAGMVARALVFALIGAFLVFAAVTSDPNQAEGFGGALETVEAQPYGDLLLGAAALGLVAFGLFGLSEALFAKPAKARKHRKR